ncbi:Hypothetical_protein [Hexamita inflata]|uniref:Hypothetical_protein n=1 Tax=Hexamita inflata TaxID=28002 RepID=A0AA86NRZ0_9EUKA|nr:Hypothetical protein HINF_LOCUS11411 [Hexamita inflata]
MYYLGVKKYLFYALDSNYSVNVLYTILSIFRCQIQLKLNSFTQEATQLDSINIDSRDVLQMLLSCSTLEWNQYNFVLYILQIEIFNVFAPITMKPDIYNSEHFQPKLFRKLSRQQIYMISYELSEK